MMIRKLKCDCCLWFFMLFSLILNSTATPTNITAKVPTYKQKSISVYILTHQLFDDPQLLAHQTIGNDGILDVTFNVDETQQIYFDLESYHIYFLISPGDSFNVELPVYKAKSNEDKYNLFYQPTAFYMIPMSGDSRGLNANITRFEYMSDTLFRKAVTSTQYGTDHVEIPAIINLLNQKVEQEKDPFLKQYKHFSTTPFYALAYPLDPNIRIDSFFVDLEPQLNNPGFWEAFMAAFSQNATSENETVFAAAKANIKAQTLDGLETFLQQHYKLKNERLGKLVLLKTMLDLWHKEKKMQTDIIKTMANFENYFQDPKYRTIAINMRDFLTRVYPGQAAPYYELPTAKGKLIPLAIKRNVVVLNFCSPELQQCARDFMALESIKDALGRKLEIINIVVYQEEDAFREFAKKQNGKTHFVHWNKQQKLLRDYQVKGLPSYYIIDPDGNFVSSPAPGPDKGLRSILETIMTQY